ncbi:hypothetical protein [Mycobacterium intracellulare]|uniref:hypothetical protein n=1 Tax=Mycobacterium intracellulare TaxID=1767 RepID=UPI0034D5CF12
MSLTDLQAEVESYRAEAGQLAEEYAQRQAEVAANPNFTPAGKREHLEVYHGEVVSQISELREREKSAVKAAKESIERRLFGLAPSASNDPARIVSFRDATARARQLEDADEAEEIYHSALRSGDQVLATAVLERALVRGWSSIKADFLERNQAARSDLDDLAALAKYQANSLATVAHYMPPSLDLPHPAGFPDTRLHTRSEPQRPPSIADEMARRVGMSQ